MARALHVDGGAGVERLSREVRIAFNTNLMAAGRPEEVQLQRTDDHAQLVPLRGDGMLIVPV